MKHCGALTASSTAKTMLQIEIKSSQKALDTPKLRIAASILLAFTDGIHEPIFYHFSPNIAIFCLHTRESQKKLEVSHQRRIQTHRVQIKRAIHPTKTK